MAKAESFASAKDPMNLIQIMLAKGDKSCRISSLSLVKTYDRDKKFF
jgi:hypothetical protein